MRSRHLGPILLLTLMVGIFFAPQVLGGTSQWDAIDVHYSAQRFISEAIKSGHLPFWTPLVFSGFPFLADLQVGAWYPLNWPFFAIGVTPNTMSHELLLHTLIACVGAYALAMRVLASKPLPALAAGMFYGLSGYFAGHSQHVGMVETAAWLPWLVLALQRVAECASTRRVAVCALLGSAIALPGHFQTALYALSGAALWAVLDALVRWNPTVGLRYGVGVAAVAVWGGAMAAVMILPGLELTRQSLRAGLNAADIDLGYFQLEDLLTLIQPDHYGVLLGSAYTGPGDVTQHYFYAGLLLVPLAVIGLLDARARTIALLLGLPFIWYALGPIGGLFNLLAQLPGFRSVELPMHGWFLPALGLALLGGAGLARLPKAVAMAVVVVVFADVYTFNQLQNRLTFARASSLELYDAPLAEFEARIHAAQPPVQRIYGPPLTSVVYRNHALQTRVETTYGYNPLELAGYAEYADAAEQNARLIDGFAANYGPTLQPIASALPLAYFARSATFLPDEGAVAARLNDLDPATETLLAGAPLDVRFDPTASVQVVQRAEDDLTLRYRSGTQTLLRVAMPIYPGWHASLNGAELPTLRADHAFIGIVVPAGEGDIQLVYTPRFFWWGAAISLVATILGAAALMKRDRRHPWALHDVSAWRRGLPRRSDRPDGQSHEGQDERHR